MHFQKVVNIQKYWIMTLIDTTEVKHLTNLDAWSVDSIWTWW